MPPGRPLVLAHRGDTSTHAENTLAALSAAAPAGADGVELDVRRAADGTLVVHHDPEVPGYGPIASLAGGDLPDWLPRLDDALDALAGWVNVELKDLPGEPGWDAGETLAQAVATRLAERDEAGRVIVSSFSLTSIDAVRRTEPGLPTGFLTLARYDQRQALDTIVERGHAYLHPHESAITPELVTAAKARGRRVAAWTVNDESRAVALADMGVDVLITDRVRELTAALSARG